MALGSSVILRKPTSDDVMPIQALINAQAKSSKLLPRSLNNLYEHLRDFWLADSDGIVRGCCALQVSWRDLAEIRSLAVAPDWRGQGIASRLLDNCVREAADLKIARVFLLTEIPDFFARRGFQPIDKATLPHKIWSDCVQCVHFPDCCEVAMIRDAVPPLALNQEAM